MVEWYYRWNTPTKEKGTNTNTTIAYQAARWKSNLVDLVSDTDRPSLSLMEKVSWMDERKAEEVVDSRGRHREPGQTAGEPAAETEVAC